MATDEGGRPRGSIEPLVAGVSDGVAAGYQALELVIEGLRESLRLQSRSAPATPRLAAASPAAGQSVPRGLIEDLAAIIAELLGRAGAIAQDVGQTIGDQSEYRAGPTCIPELALKARAGKTA